jgi:fatty-acid desaturase
MIFHGFIHADGGEIHDSIFRSNVVQFVNDTETHPILKYQAFIIAFILIVSGLLILLLFNGEKIFGHSYWKHLFSPVSLKKNKDPHYMSDAAIFRQAVEGMSSNDGKATNKSGQYTSSDKDGYEKSKKTACGTDCGQYIELKNKIKDLSKYVDAVKEQTESIKVTEAKITELGKKIEDVNKSLSPGGQLDIAI